MKHEDALDLLYLAHRALAELEAIPKDFGTGEALYPNEIHAIAAVADHPGCNLTEAAAALGVSLAAASKSLGKMIAAGYIEKQAKPGSGKEVVFGLSAKGRVAAQGHAAFEAEHFGALRAIEHTLPAPEREIICRYLMSIRDAIRPIPDKTRSNP